jgi:hypothetical protein
MNRYWGDKRNDKFITARDLGLFEEVLIHISYFWTWSSLDWSGSRTVPYLIDVNKQDYR